MYMENIGQYMQIGNKLKVIRQQHGKSQKEIAKSVGVAHSTYSNYENGNRTPNMSTLKRIADYYGISVKHLLQLDNLKENREKNNISLDEIADELGAPTSLLKLIEQGAGDLVTSSKYQRIIEALKNNKEQELSKNELITNINHYLKKLNRIGVKAVLNYIHDILENPKYTTPDEPRTTSEQREKEE